MVNALLLFGFYATPILYSVEFVQEKMIERGLEQWYPLLFANPMAGFVTAYRSLLFDGELPSISVIGWPILCSILVFLIGLKVFCVQSPTLSDKL
jgi:ABC-type polysaccharide/polyol phosphate export permease